MKHALLLLPFALCLQGCDDSNADPSSADTQAVSYQILHQAAVNAYGDETSKSAVLLRDYQSYEDELIKRSSDSAAAVNFDTHSVLLIDMGPKPTSGYRIRLDSLVTEGDYVRAQVIHSVSSGPNCNFGTALTNPYTFIEIESRKDVFVTEKVEVSDC